MAGKMKMEGFVRKIGQHKKIAIIFLVIITLFCIYKSDTLMLDFTEGTPFEGYFYYGVNKFSKFYEEMNPFRIRKDLLDGTLLIYNIKLSKKDLEHFEAISAQGIKDGYLDSSINTWRDAELEANTKKYQIKVRLRGDIEAHWNDKLKSYDIKAEKTKFINNMGRIRLILFEDRFLGSKITQVIAKQLGLPFAEDDFVVLKINGVVQGVYYLQENFDESLLEKSKLVSGTIIRITDNWIEDHPRLENGTVNGLFLMSHFTPFSYEISNLDIGTDYQFKEEAVFTVSRLFDAIENKKIDEIKTFFDMDYLTSFEALRMILGNSRSVAGDNLKLFYSFSNGKFYPLPDFEWTPLEQLQLEKGGFEHTLGFLAGNKVELFSLLLQDDEIRYLRNKKVYALLKDSTLTGEVDNLVEKYLPYTTSYKANKLSSRIMKRTVNGYPDAIGHNIRLIKENLEYAKSYFNVVYKGNKINIEILPDSIAQIKFNRFKMNLFEDYSGKITLKHKKEDGTLIIQSLDLSKETKQIDLLPFFEGLYFSAGLDEDLYPVKRVYEFEITFENTSKINLNNFDLEMENDVTGQILPIGDIYLQVADGNDYYTNQEITFDEFKLKYNEFSWSYENNKLYLNPGKYILKRNLIVPKNLELNILPGVEISIAENESIISYRTTNILGTKEQPIIIKALNPSKPFGVFGVVGEKNDSAIIRWLDLSGGNEKFINGIYFSGGLSLYHVNVDISDSKIHQNHADDGLNIKYATVKVDNILFYDNFADQFDCDFCTGLVENSDFRDMEEGDANGDGLDFSGSKVLVKTNNFRHFKDKGLSVGEETEIIACGNQFINNNLGAAIKDSSHAFFIDNTFQNNNVSVTAYQKKQLFKGGYIYVFDNVFKNNNKESEMDELSKLYEINFEGEDSKQLIEEINKNSVEAAFRTMDKYKQWKTSEDTS